MNSGGLAMMPWFPGDFMRSTRGWSVTARGVYRELLDAQWDMGELPEDPQELRGIIGATPEEWSMGWKKCASKFPVRGSARLNVRLEKHRSKSEQIASIRSTVGRLGGKASGKAKAKQKLSISVANAEPIAKANGHAIGSEPFAKANAKPQVNHPIQSIPIHSESNPNPGGKSKNATKGIRS